MSLVMTGLASAVTDYSSLTSAIDFTDATAAVLLAAAALGAIYVVKKGAHIILGFFGR